MEHIISKNKKAKFYSKSPWYFALGLGVIIIGFYGSYFTQLKQNDISHHLHGMAALLWMLLLIVQPLLISKKGIKWHRWLGWASVALVPLIVFSGLRMIQVMVLGKAHYPPMAPYQFALVDFFSLIQFVLFFVMAIVTRKRMQLHARYMAATVFIFIIPGLGRALLLIPTIDTVTKMLNVTFVLTEIALIILLIDDKRKGKIRLPYVLALLLFVIQHVGFNTVAHLDWWQALMDGYAKL